MPSSIGGPAAWPELFPALAAGDAATRALMDSARALEMPHGYPLFRAGAPCESYLLLLAGRVRVQVMGEGGREAVLYRVLPGESCVLTTCCILAGQPYPAEAFTESGAAALLLGRAAFERGLTEAPAFRRFVFGKLGSRIATAISRIGAVVSLPVEHRLAAYLLERTAHAPRTPLPVTHQEIAAELGTAREVVSRNLKRFEAVGLVRRGRGTLEVCDRPGLERIHGHAV